MDNSKENVFKRLFLELKKDILGNSLLLSRSILILVYCIVMTVYFIMVDNSSSISYLATALCLLLLQSINRDLEMKRIEDKLNGLIEALKNIEVTIEEKEE